MRSFSSSRPWYLLNSLFMCSFTFGLCELCLLPNDVWNQTEKKQAEEEEEAEMFFTFFNIFSFQVCSFRIMNNYSSYYFSFFLLYNSILIMIKSLYCKHTTLRWGNYKQLYRAAEASWSTSSSSSQTEHSVS